MDGPVPVEGVSGPRPVLTHLHRLWVNGKAENLVWGLTQLISSVASLIFTPSTLENQSGEDNGAEVPIQFYRKD